MYRNSHQPLRSLSYALARIFFHKSLFAIACICISAELAAAPFESFQLTLRPQSELSFLPTPPRIEENQIVTRYFALQRLQEAALIATEAVHVPYIWGGNRIGSEEECMRCNLCLSEKQTNLKGRVSKCPSCAKCGIDCSHLMNQIFASAGLEIPYAASSILANAPASVLRREYQLIDMGRDFSVARPGDIIVYRRHVGLLMANHGGQRGDLIHASRFAGKGRAKVGGIRYDIGSNIVRPRGGLVRILRHEKLDVANRIPLS